MSKILQEMNEAVENLSNELESNSKTTLKVTDLSLPYSHLFNVAASKALSVKIQTQTNQRRNKLGLLVCDEVEYISSIAIGKKNIIKAAGKVMDIVNRHALEGHITGSLMNLSLLELAIESYEMDRYAVMIFPLFTTEGSKLLWQEKLPEIHTEEELQNPKSIVR